MGSLLYNAVYTFLPCLIAAFAAALYATSRTIAPRNAWLLGFLIATLLVVGAVVVVSGASQLPLPVSSLARAYVALYFIPFVVLTGAALALRSRVETRIVGLVVLIALALVTNVVARYVSGHFLDLVNAAG